MVLTLKRATAIALILGTPIMVPLLAQQSRDANPVRTGEVRPLLYGFALECIGCLPGERGRGRGGAGQPPVLSYRSFPHVIAVAPGSAAEQAGIRAGDVLQSIDGLSVMTAAGAERLAHATAGQSARLAFARDSKPVVVSIVLGAAGPSGRNAPESKRVFGGYMAIQGSARGAIKLEIWSDDPIFPTDSTGSVVLRIGTSTLIKLQVARDSTDSSDSSDSSATRTGQRGTSDTAAKPPRPPSSPQL